MLYVVVLSVVVNACDVVDVGMCLLELSNNCCVVPVLVWWLNKCIVVVGVFVLVVVLVKLVSNGAASIDSCTSCCGYVCVIVVMLCGAP